MANTAAQNAMALIGANLHPGGWTKGESHEENLRTFNKWYKAYCRYTNVCLRSINVDVTQKWDLFAATGGEDLCDAMEEAGIIMIQREHEDAIHTCHTGRQDRKITHRSSKSSNMFREFRRSRPLSPHHSKKAWRKSGR